jgi:predicted AAA+ superfamily ATPase
LWHGKTPARYYQRSISFSCWRGKKNQEVDIIADSGKRLVPFEVKYRGQKVATSDLKGLIQFCQERKVSRGYVITKDAADFGVLPLSTTEGISLVKGWPFFTWIRQAS